MTDTHTETLSAFCDGEPVDPDRLAAALADAPSREALVDFARLRAAVASSRPLPDSLLRLRPALVVPEESGARLCTSSQRPRWAVSVGAQLTLPAGVARGVLH